MIYCIIIENNKYKAYEALPYQIESYYNAIDFYKKNNSIDITYEYNKFGYKFKLKNYKSYFEMIKDNANENYNTLNQYIVEDIDDNLNKLLKIISCPICNDGKKISARYPNAVCRKCYNKTLTIDNKKIIFYNKDMFGGFISEVDGITGNNNICYIDGKKCYATEAKFGGIVVQASIE